MTQETRLQKLEQQNAPPVEIRVVIIDHDRYYAKDEDLNGPGLSEDEYRAAYPIGPDDHVIYVGYADMTPEQIDKGR
jgi:hypothetical protein